MVKISIFEAFLLVGAVAVTTSSVIGLANAYNSLGIYRQTQLGKALLNGPETLLDIAGRPARVQEYVLHIQKGRELDSQRPEPVISAPEYDAFTG